MAPTSNKRKKKATWINLNIIKHTHVQAFNNMHGLHTPSTIMNLLTSPKQYMENFVSFPGVDSNKIVKDLKKIPKTFKLGQQLWHSSTHKS